MIKISTSLVWALSVACSTQTVTPQPQEIQPAPLPAAAAGQLIVKLTGSSAGGQALKRALSASELHHDPDLVAYLVELSAEVGAPLSAMRLTSGSEVVLTVDLEQLTAAVLKRLGEDRRVERAARYESSGTPHLSPFGGTPPRAEWRVELAGEEVAALISAARRSDHATTPELEATIAELGESLGYDLACRVDAEAGLVLELDLSELTETLRARLAEHPEVEYVELDRLLQHYQR